MKRIWNRPAVAALTLILNGAFALSARAETICHDRVNATRREGWQKNSGQLSFCADRDLSNVLSRDCAKKPCAATEKHALPIAQVAGGSAFGNPLVIACQTVGGETQLWELATKPFAGRKLEVCRFADGSFADLATWYKRSLRFGPGGLDYF